MKLFFLPLLATIAIADDVIVSWDPSTSTNVTYNVYWIPSPLQFSVTPSTNVVGTNIVVKDVNLATRFRVTAVNELGYESIPTPFVEYTPQNVATPSNLNVRAISKKP